jgi:hypothetical protein
MSPGVARIADIARLPHVRLALSADISSIDAWAANQEAHEFALALLADALRGSLTLNSVNSPG